MAAPNSPGEFAGGWLRSPTQQPAGADAPTPTGPRRGRDLENSTVVSRTVKQLLLSKMGPDDTFKIDGREVTTVAILGLILEARIESTHYDYKIDDGSGCIDVRVWFQQDTPSDQDQYKEGQYVRVTGSLRSFNDQKSIMSWRMHPITDFNELTWHGLSIIHAHLQHTRGFLNPTAAAPTTSTGTVPPAHISGPEFAPHPTTSHAPAPAPPPPPAETEKPMTRCQTEVMRILSSGVGGTGEGITIEEVVKMLEAQYTEKEVRDTVESLYAEGRLFSTSDEEHYTANT